jgi:chaperonin GroEL
MRQIVANSGEEGAVIIGKIREHKDKTFGYDAQTGQFADMIKVGVVDPTKVARIALQNAGSIAALMLTTEALVCDIPEEKKEPSMPHGGGGMGGMY